MRRPQQPLYVTFAVAFLLAGCDPGATNSPASASGGAAAADRCQKFLMVSVDNDPHFELGERYRITGPSPVGDYRLHPLGPSQILPKDHPVVKSSSTAPNEFSGEIDIKGGPHGQPILHLYDVDMQFDSNDCPSRLALETDVHPGDPGFPDHGGDIVMN